jgi:hypothetical protein
MKYLLTLCITIIFAVNAYSQNGNYYNYLCSFESKNVRILLDNGFINNAEAESVLNNILLNSGLPGNIELLPTFDIENARATAECESLNDCRRIILYNPKFMKNVKKHSKSNWGEIGIIAHEVGHHLAGHTTGIQASSSSELKQNELEADYFAGFILAKMGADIEDAILAVSKFSTNLGNSTHPGRSDRIAAVTKGWQKSKGIKPSRFTRVRPLGTSAPSVSYNPNMKTLLNSVVLIYNANDVNGSADRLGKYLSGEIENFKYEAQTVFKYRSLYSTTKILFITPEYEDIARRIEKLIPGQQELINYSDKSSHGFFGLENRDIVIFVGKDWQ